MYLGGGFVPPSFFGVDMPWPNDRMLARQIKRMTDGRRFGGTEVGLRFDRAGKPYAAEKDRLVLPRWPGIGVLTAVWRRIRPVSPAMDWLSFRRCQAPSVRIDAWNPYADQLLRDEREDAQKRAEIREQSRDFFRQVHRRKNGWIGAGR
jgi:hypothetical protein